VTAELRRPAQLDRAHHAPFNATELAIACSAIGLAVAAEDIRHFKF
jgi:hypothetical protein